MYLLLGDIGYGKPISPNALDIKRSTSYAEHQVIEGKPLLQYTGADLDEISLAFLFHADFCVPQRKWDELVELFSNHQAFPLSQGNGLVLGSFVITDLERVSIASGDDGTPYAIECRVALKEYVDPAPLESKRKQQKAQAAAMKKPGGRAKRPASKKDIPQLSADSKNAGYALSLDKKTVVKLATRR